MERPITAVRPDAYPSFDGACECFIDNALCQFNLIIGKFGELPIPTLAPELALILPNERNQARGKPVWHLDGIHDRTHGGVMGLQIINLSRQILFDRPSDAFIQEFCFGCAIEETVEIR